MAFLTGCCQRTGGLAEIYCNAKEHLSYTKPYSTSSYDGLDMPSVFPAQFHHGRYHALASE